MDRNSYYRDSPLGDNFVEFLIRDIKKLWLKVRMFRGYPHSSESNGGIERMNIAMENKLGDWMKDKNSQAWSVG